MFKYELQIVHLVRGVTVCRILNELYTHTHIIFFFFAKIE